MNKNLNHNKDGFHFGATGIGSVPFLDVRETCLYILKCLPDIPFWPQMVRRSHVEDMHIQSSEGLPLLEVIEDKRALVVSADHRESRLVAFYDRFLADDLDYFAISKEYAPGLFDLGQMIQEHPEKYGPYIKGQIVGPVTFAAGITAQDGRSLLADSELLEAMVKGLSIKALWQVREMGRCGKKPLIFLDEPSLSGFGSAFSPIQRHEVVSLLKEMIDYVRQRSDALIGIHCCGNTDWSMIIEAAPDIISFDAFEYVDYFLLYAEQLSRFMEDGGIIAWGIVPTSAYSGQESVEGIFSGLKRALNRFSELEIDSEALIRNAILTPSCGMGTMDETSAHGVLDLLSALPRKCDKIRL
jgi:methionine synthase II (cobalamin-independent)